MKNCTIRFSRNDAFCDYLTALLTQKTTYLEETMLAGELTYEELPVAVSSDTRDDKTTMTLSASDADILDAVSESVCLFRKLRDLQALLPKKSGVLHASLLGALVGHKHAEETERLRKRIRDVRYLNVDGIYNFLMTDLSQEWTILGTFAGKLYEQCADEEDVKTLVKYFMSGTPLTKRTLVLDNGIYYDDDNRDVPLAHCFADADENDAFFLLYLRPLGIIVPVPKRHPYALIDLIRFLGE